MYNNPMRSLFAAFVLVSFALAQNTPVESNASAAAKLREIVYGQRVATMLGVVAELGVADLLKEGPKSAEDLARATKTHGPSLYRVLRALASYDIFFEEDDGRFRLTTAAELLRSDVPGSQRESARALAVKRTWQSWGHMLEAVRTGKTGTEHAFGMNLWEYMAKHPDDAKTFNERMAEGTRREAGEIVKSYDFSGSGKVVDIAGGNGVFLEAILKFNPQRRAILFELPSVIEAAKARLAPAIAARMELTSGDFFKVVPAGGDVYILKNILHDWDEERSVAILQNCQRAMGKTAKLLVIEGVVPKGNSRSPAKIQDINMLVMTGGRERTEAEHRALLEKGGFRVNRIIPATPATSIIEALPRP